MLDGHFKGKNLEPYFDWRSFFEGTQKCVNSHFWPVLHSSLLVRGITLNCHTTAIRHTPDRLHKCYSSFATQLSRILVISEMDLDCWTKVYCDRISNIFLKNPLVQVDFYITIIVYLILCSSQFLNKGLFRTEKIFHQLNQQATTSWVFKNVYLISIVKAKNVELIYFQR